jgi:hypothetical protein
VAERTEEAQRALDVLACEIGRRPVDAPHLTDLAPAVRAVRRDGTALVVELDPAAAEAAAAAVAAERLCCPEIGWHLERGDDGHAGRTLTLRIEAAPVQLDALEPLLR